MVMKAVILAGGLGTRIMEESTLRPKPMVEIGGRPILWHIMKGYASHGLTDFVICLGYKGYMIKEYFANYVLHNSDLTVDLAGNAMTLHGNVREPWRVTLVDTGEKTMTGGRLKRAAKYLDDGPFCCTYGDGVGNIDVRSLVAFHRSHGKSATVTAVQPPGRYGALDIEGDRVAQFIEKPIGDRAWINGGFFVFEQSILDLIESDDMPLETTPLETLAAKGELAAFRHRGYWQAMDTLRERQVLEELWNSGQAPWKTW
jgi:glucose-1-phosphate cytidylyltransferase